MYGNGILSGKKSYIVGALGVLSAIGGYLVGDIDLSGLINSLIAGLGLITLRSGIKNDTSN